WNHGSERLQPLPGHSFSGECSSRVLHEEGDQFRPADDVSLADLLHHRQLAGGEHVIGLLVAAADAAGVRLHPPNQLEVFLSVHGHPFLATLVVSVGHQRTWIYPLDIIDASREISKGHYVCGKVSKWPSGGASLMGSCFASRRGCGTRSSVLPKTAVDR